MVKNPPPNARDAESAPGLECSPREEVTTHSSILAWEIRWTEEPDRLHSTWGHKESDMTKHTHEQMINFIMSSLSSHELPYVNIKMTSDCSILSTAISE